MIPSVFRGVDLTDLETIKVITRQAYPLVPQISTGTLAEWMLKPEPWLILIDVRTREEFAVSHLRGALNMQSADEIAAVARTQGHWQTTLYCSVGFRSSRLAHRLAQQGLRHIMNLEGSIFEWANEGRVLYQEERPVQLVHPYARRWAGLLKPGLASRC